MATRLTAWLRLNRVVMAMFVLCLVAAYAFYAVDGAKATSMFNFAWSFAIPLVFAALTGVIGERSGVVNIGIEGQILVSAFVGFFAAAGSGSLLVGVLAGVASGALLGLFLAWISVVLGVDQVIAGVVLNIVATGITSFYYVQGKSLPRVMPAVGVPGLKRIPLIGTVFFDHRGVLALLALAVVPVLHWLLFRTRWGLRTRASGEYPSAADTAGIDVPRLRVRNVALAGLFAGCAGVYLSLEKTSTFERGMSAGKGFLALAIMIFGAWRPLRVFAAALFFGFAAALASQLQADKVIDIPQQFINALPFVLTLVVLAIAAGRVRAPAAAGQPFVKARR